MKRISVIFFLSFLVFINNAKAQIYGCTDPLATNFSLAATVNNGNCIYNETSVSPVSDFDLPDNLTETSGLINWNDRIWTHNDNGDINIYSLDTANGKIVNSVCLSRTVNNDWEEISQDDHYIYIGDFGNNSNGNRTDLKILRVDKNSVSADSPIIDTINFSYSDQVDFTPSGANNSDFDCEAFIVSHDSIYLFTKQWVSNKTAVYSLAKIPGTYIAKFKTAFDVQGLITGSVYLESKKLIVLCGYTNSLEPFIYLLYDFAGTDYFSGNKRKISVSLPYHQIEGVATNDGLKYYISNENFTRFPFISNPQQIHILDLNTYLGYYFKNVVTASESLTQNDFLIFPDPARDFLTIQSTGTLLPADYFLINQSGQVVLNGKLNDEISTLSISHLSVGLYILKIGEKNRESFKVIKR